MNRPQRNRISLSASPPVARGTCRHPMAPPPVSPVGRSSGAALRHDVAFWCGRL